MNTTPAQTTPTTTTAPPPPTTTDLPAAVLAYFDRMEGDQKHTVAELFAPDAVVIDDGRTYRGREEITGWLTGQASEFTTTSTHLSADRTDRTVVVLIRVEGTFPGGRVDLRNAFTLDGAGRLTALTITA